LQFYYNDLKEATERERISRENHVLIFKRIINKYILISFKVLLGLSMRDQNTHNRALDS